jgi:hypothetical protein
MPHLRTASDKSQKIPSLNTANKEGRMRKKRKSRLLKLVRPSPD